LSRAAHDTPSVSFSKKKVAQNKQGEYTLPKRRNLMKTLFFRACNLLVLVALLAQSCTLILQSSVPVVAAGPLCAVTSRYVPVDPGMSVGAGGKAIPFNGAQSASGQLSTQPSGYPISEFAEQVSVGFECIKQKANAYERDNHRCGWDQAKKDANCGWWDNCPNRGIIKLFNGACMDKDTYVSQVRTMFDADYAAQAVALAKNQTSARAKEIVDINAAIDGGCSGQGISPEVCKIIKAMWWHESRWQPGAPNYQWCNSKKPVSCGGPGNQFVVDSNGKLKSVGIGFSAVANYFPNDSVSTTVSDPRYDGSQLTSTGTGVVADNSANLTTIDNSIAKILSAPYTDQSDALKKSLETNKVLPASILGDCQANFSPAKGASLADQNKSNKSTLIKCISSILRIAFIVGILLLIIRIAAAQLGYVASAGESNLGGGGGGGGPIVATRNAIRDGLIGLVLVGGAILILELFTSGLGSAFSSIFGS
jgi:hypothetical protein